MTNIISISNGCPRASSSIIPRVNNSKKIADFQKALTNKKIKDENGNAKRTLSKGDITFLTLVTFKKIELSQENLDKFREILS